MIGLSTRRVRAIGSVLLGLGLLAAFGCSHAIPRWGKAGRYLEAKQELTRRGGNLDQAIANLEGIVKDDPLYQDSLTLLARSYYKRGRYKDAFEILRRAVAVRKEDEIAWVVLGLTQIRLGNDESGLESLKGGLTLLSGAMKDGYRDFPAWDKNGLVRASLRRAVLLAAKGLEEKTNLMQATETLLVRIDEEEWYQRGDKQVDRHYY